MEDFTKSKVSVLRKKCKELGLSITGNKTDVIARIQEHLDANPDKITANTINEAELLGEIDNTELDQSISSNVDEDLLLGDSTSEKNKPAEVKQIKPVKTVGAKDVVEEAKVLESKTEEPPAKIAKLDETEDSTENGSAAKTQELTEEERKLQRANRFNVKAVKSDDEIKKGRAARFGIVTEDEEKKVDIDKLKSREKRFGVAVSKTLQTAEEDDKKKRRMERFGVENATEVTKEAAVEIDDKKAKRAARFGLNNEVNEDKKQARAARFGTAK